MNFIVSNKSIEVIWSHLRSFRVMRHCVLFVCVFRGCLGDCVIVTFLQKLDGKNPNRPIWSVGPVTAFECICLFS